MKKTAFVIGLLLLLAVAVSPASAIVGGEPDTTHTNVGAIMMVWPQFDDIVGRLCTATLIHKRALLTAAHCTTYIENQGIDYDQVWVTFAHDPFADEAEYLDVKTILVHPDYGSSANPDSHDIALVILKKPVDGIEPEPLPEIGAMDDLLDSLTEKGRRDLELDLIVVGYGTSEFLEPPATQLDAERKIGTVSFENLLPFEIQTKQESDLGSMLCMGDSGGPAFYVDEGGTEVMVGALSRSAEPNACDGPMFHYRVDTLSAREFIEENLP